MKKSILLIPMMLLGMAVTFSPALAADEEKGEIVFADVGWDSIKLNNAIAGLIAEEVRIHLDRGSQLDAHRSRGSDQR